jgi:hypothetical protein
MGAKALPITSTRAGHLPGALGRVGRGRRVGAVIRDGQTTAAGIRHGRPGVRRRGQADGEPVTDGVEREVDPAGGPWRVRLARACAAHVRLGPATLLLYDMTTLYFETDEATD